MIQFIQNIHIQNTLPDRNEGETPLEHLTRCINNAANKILGEKWSDEAASSINCEIDNCLYVWINNMGYYVTNMPRADADGHRRQGILEAKNRELKGSTVLRYNSGNQNPERLKEFQKVSNEEFWNRHDITDIQRNRGVSKDQRAMDVSFIDKDGNPYFFDERWNTGFGL